MMNKTEFQVIRGVLRWAGAGLMPHGAVMGSALNGVETLGVLPQGEKIRAVLESLGRGVLPKQRDCQDAAAALEALRDRLEDANYSTEVPRG